MAFLLSKYTASGATNTGESKDREADQQAQMGFICCNTVEVSFYCQRKEQEQAQTHVQRNQAHSLSYGCVMSGRVMRLNVGNVDTRKLFSLFIYNIK